MMRRGAGGWLLASSLTLAPVLVARAASTEPSPRGPVSAEEGTAIGRLLAAMDVLGGGRLRPPERSFASAEAFSERPREACFNDRSLPWLPAVELPHQAESGQAALGWRPGWLLAQRPRQWLVGTLAAAALAATLDLALRLRGWRWLAVAAALAPFAAGVWLACGHLDRLSEGLSLPWSCVPREGVFQRHAQLVRDSLTLGAMASFAVLGALGAMALFTWRPWRLRTVAPAFGLLALLTAMAWRWWAGGVEGELARQVSQSTAGAYRLRLPTAPGLTPERLPDVPLVLVSADGTLRYDDSRGQRPPTALPWLMPLADPVDLGMLHRDDGGRPPFYLLAIDERATWQSLQRAVEPFGQPDFLLRQWLLFGPVTSDARGSAPRAPGLPPGRLQTPFPGSILVCSKSVNISGLLADDGLHLLREMDSLSEGCQLPGTGAAVSRQHLDHETLSRCLDRLRESVPASIDRYRDWAPQDLGLSLAVKLSPGTLWREVALLEDVVAQKQADASKSGHGSLDLHIDGLDDGF